MNRQMLWVLLIVIAVAAIVWLSVHRAARKSADAKRRADIDRLLTYFDEERDLQFFVGVPLESPTLWTRVVKLENGLLVTEDGQRLPVEDARRFVVAYPNGELLDRIGSTTSLPGRVHGRNEAGEPESDTLTRADLAEGNRFIRVTYDPSKRKPKDPSCYSTTLTNISDQRVRVTKFGGYHRQEAQWVLSTVSGGFFTAGQFRAWYGMGDRDWLEPGQAASDPDNYGSRPVLWAYYCETESGHKFIAGGILER